MIRVSAVAVLMFCCVLDVGSAWGRGFGGGMRGGGGFGGGMRGGFGGGGMRGGFGGGGYGGFRGSGFNGFRGGESGGFRGGNYGGFRGNEFGGIGNRGAGQFGGRSFGGAQGERFGGEAQRGGAPNRMQMNQFLGLPSDAGMHSFANSRSAGDFNMSRGIAEGSQGQLAGATATGRAAVGEGGAAVAHGTVVGPEGGTAAGTVVRGPEGGVAARGAVVGPEGRAAAGTAVRGPEGGVAARGVVAGPEGAAAGYAYRSPSGRYAAAYGVRAGYVGRGLYTPGWYAGHPGAWAYAGMATSAWAAADWASLDNWFALDSQPVYYDYGSNVVTNGDNVYVNNEDVGTTQQYYQQAAELANAGTQSSTSNDSNWLPLGVFAMTPADKSDKNMIIQLAVDKTGTIRGNFTDTAKNETFPVQGSVDKKTQRAAWTIGDKKNDVVETGLYNLTKEEVPALVHIGPDQTQQWLLVRLKQQDDSSSAQQAH